MSKLKISSDVLVGRPPQMIEAHVAGFLGQPLPVLAMVDIRMCVKALSDRAKAVTEAHIELIKRYGGVEREKDVWALPETLSAKKREAFDSDVSALRKSTFELPITEKIRIPSYITVAGRRNDIVISYEATEILSEFVEFFDPDKEKTTQLRKSER